MFFFSLVILKGNFSISFESFFAFLFDSINHFTYLLTVFKIIT